MSTATMLGDVVADPYASLMETQTFKGLIDMLVLACRDGIEAVPDAPPELRAFIEAMEATPDWVDMDLVREGARHERIPTAYVAPYVMRGAFVATFMNTYAALPMALTGTLGGRKAARRVHETASFFAVTTLPGALERDGRGFEAAAMVRLMHSMVRYNALKRSDAWDLGVYGIPVPQVDQMPAGLINVYVLASEALRKGRTEFNDRERSIVEFARYRCFLLGLPEELLPTTVEDTLHLLHARAALLRDGYDDQTCGALVRATMDCRLRTGDGPWDRAAEALEKSYSKSFFVNAFAGGKSAKAAEMGVSFGTADRVRVAVTAPFVIGRFLGPRGQHGPAPARRHRRPGDPEGQAPPRDLRQARVRDRRGRIQPVARVAPEPRLSVAGRGDRRFRLGPGEDVALEDRRRVERGEGQGDLPAGLSLLDGRAEDLDAADDRRLLAVDRHLIAQVDRRALDRAEHARLADGEEDLVDDEPEGAVRPRTGGRRVGLRP